MDGPLINDPKIAATITRVAEQTGIPVARFEDWLASEPPPGITRADWLDALASTSEAPPLTPGQLGELQNLVAPTIQANAA
jgi:hypothetical protein